MVLATGVRSSGDNTRVRVLVVMPIAYVPMQVHRQYDSEPPGLRTVATLGTFDGVHLGHQGVLAGTVEEACMRGIESAVVTFVEHPAVVLRAESAPPLLTSLEDRLDLIAGCGVDHAFLVEFDEGEAQRTALEFTEEVLLGWVGAEALVVGYDLHFGHKRRGNLAFLKELGRERGFEVVSIDALKEMPLTLEPISSTAIRRALLGGDVAHAEKMLGRLYEISGEVVLGDQRGRQIGFPTANIPLPPESAVPADGVYAGWLERPEGLKHPCAINIGRRPTFYLHAEQSLLEAHLLDFDGDLYGEVCRVSFADFLRGERRFDGVDSLVAQLKDDVIGARRVLGC